MIPPLFTLLLQIILLELFSVFTGRCTGFFFEDPAKVLLTAKTAVFGYNIDSNIGIP